jgi:hypothetical protein
MGLSIILHADSGDSDCDQDVSVGKNTDATVTAAGSVSIGASQIFFCLHCFEKVSTVTFIV